jgi:hypothetical protein
MDGITGFYKGGSACLVFENIVCTIRLGLYEPVKHLFGATDPHSTPLITKIVAGAMAGLPAAFFSSPFNMI